MDFFLGKMRLCFLNVFLFFLFALDASASSYFKDIKRGKLPDGYPRTVEEIYRPFAKGPSHTYLARLDNRRTIRGDYGMYFYPSRKWMDRAVSLLKDHGAKQYGHEIMAGAGWLSYYLTTSYGFTMVATDESPDEYRYKKYRPHFTVRKEEAVTAISNDVHAEFIVLSWPFMAGSKHNKRTGKEENWDPALAALKQWDCRGPVLYIGEQTGGSTGSPELDDYLASHYWETSLSDNYIPVHLQGSVDAATEIQDYPSIYIPRDIAERGSDVGVRERLPRKGCLFVKLRKNKKQ